MPTYRLRVGDQMYSVDVGDVSRSPVEVNVDGQTYFVELEDSQVSPSQPRTRRGRRPPTRTVPPAIPRVGGSVPAFDPSDKVLRAPMPGRVIAIRVRPGDRVAAGDEVCVVEAMKMEQSIRAAQDGVVKEIYVQPMDSVGANDALIQLE